MNKKIHITEHDKKTGLNALNKGLQAGYITKGVWHGNIKATFHTTTSIGGYCDFFGKAADGVIVSLGMSDKDGNPGDALLLYLSKFPEPNQW